MRGRAPWWLLLLLAWPLAARGDDVEVARARFREGTEAFDKGDFEKARTAFLQAWSLKKHPAVLRKLAESCLKSHHEAEAARYFRLYLRDTTISPADQTSAEAALTEARKSDGRIEVHAPNGAEVFLDDESVGVAPLDPVDVDVGYHTVRVRIVQPDGTEAPQTPQQVTATTGQVVAVTFAAPAPPPPPPTASASAPPAKPPRPIIREIRGGEGESCRARNDCDKGLLCVDHVCVDERLGEPCTDNDECGGGSLVCRDKTCAARHAGEGEGASAETTLTGVHPFVGVAVRGGPSFGLDTLNQSSPIFSSYTTTQTAGSVAFALRGGVLLGRHEIALEIAPFSDQYFSNIPGPAFHAVATYGYYVPLYERSGFASVYWPLRVGAGILAGGDNTGGLAFFTARADLVGIGVRLPHFLLTFELPSFIYEVTQTNQYYFSQTVHFLSWHFGASGTFVF